MNIQIKGTRVDISPSMRELIEDKLSHIEKFLHTEHQVKVEVEVDAKHTSGDLFRVEIHIVPGKFYADEKAAEFGTALDLVIDKIKQQLKKDKDKMLSQRREKID